jgi:Fe-S-cluster containining protein
LLHNIPVLSDNDQGNGVCRYLENNLCSIYENRPFVCNAEKMFETYFKQEMTKDYFIQANLDACIQIAEYFNDEVAKQSILNLIALERRL